MLGNNITIKNFLDVELKDDETLEGGISYIGETVRDFIQEMDIHEEESIEVLNAALEACGIEKKDFGWKITNLMDLSFFYVGEYFDNGISQGVIYKDFEAFSKKQGVCYINEYGFENSDENATSLFNFGAKARVATCIDDNPYVAENGYDYAMILDIADNDEELATSLFYNAEWAAIETYMNEYLESCN